MTTRLRSKTVRILETRLREPLRLRSFLIAIREGEGWTQAEMARQLRLSRSHLCDIERGRKSVTPGRAAQFAKILGYGEAQFVRLALQDLVEEAGLHMRIDVSAA